MVCAARPPSKHGPPNQPSRALLWPRAFMGNSCLASSPTMRMTNSCLASSPMMRIVRADLPSSRILKTCQLPTFFVLEPLLTRILASCITTAPETFHLCPWTAMSVFFIMFHYKTNAIFATPIPGLDLKNILDAYTKNFGYLVSKGYTPQKPM